MLDFSNLSTTRNLIFPDSDGAPGTVLGTDGAGNLSWTGAVAMQYEAHVGVDGQTIIATTMATNAIVGSRVFLQVYLNGVLQQEQKNFNVTGAHEITFATALSTGDDIAVFGYEYASCPVGSSDEDWGSVAAVAGVTADFGLVSELATSTLDWGIVVLGGIDYGLVTDEATMYVNWGFVNFLTNAPAEDWN